MGVNPANFPAGPVLPEAHASEGTHSLAISPAGAVLASGGQEGTVRLWDVKVRSEEEESSQAARAVSIRTVAEEPGQPLSWNLHRKAAGFAPDCKSFATVSTNGSILLWKTATFESLGAVEVLGNDNIAVLFSSDGRFLFTGEMTGRIRVWDPANQRVITNVAAGPVPTAPICFLPAENILVTDELHDSVRLWNTVTWEQRAVLNLDSDCWTIAFSPDGRTMATGNQGGKISLWNIPEARKLASFFAHPRYCVGLAFSPDGKTLASLGIRDLKLWDVATQQQRGEKVSIHRGIGDSVAISPDGERIAIEAGKPSLELRDFRTLQEVVSLTVGPTGGGHVEFSPDGSTLVLVGGNGIKLWRAPSLAEIEADLKKHSR